MKKQFTVFIFMVLLLTVYSCSDFKMKGKTLVKYRGNEVNVIIPEGVTSIGRYAFYDCAGLESVVIPSSVTSIGDSAFEFRKRLTSIIIPESVTSIGERAFAGCKSLTSVVIPSSVTSIGDEAFLGCNRLTNIMVDAQNREYSSIEGVLFSKDGTVIVMYPTGRQEENYTIPSGVTAIGPSAFAFSSLTSITMPESVEFIFDLAFRYCESLASITIPESVAKIGRSAFTGCSSLRSVTIPESVTFIGEDAFRNCRNLETAVVPRRTRIDVGSVFPVKVRITYSDPIYEDFEIDGTTLVKYHGDAENVTIPEGVASIGYAAFGRCTSLESVTIPESVRLIWDYAFAGCDSLESVTIPSSVNYIGIGAFSGCDNLRTVSVSRKTTIGIGEDVFPYNAQITYSD